MDYTSIREEYKKTLTNNAKNVFVRVSQFAAEYEQKFCKDLAEFSKPEIIEFVNSRSFFRPEPLRVYLNSIRSYQEYCAGANAIVPIVYQEDIDVEEAMRTSLFSTFSEIANLLADAIGLDQLHVTPPALALAWVGLSIDQTLKLKQNEVDLRNGVIDLGGKDVFDLTGDNAKALSVLRMYANTSKGYRNQNPANGNFEVSFVESDFFLRPTRTKNSRKKVNCFTRSNLVGSILFDTVNIPNKSFTYADIQFSGELRRAYLKEKSDPNLDFVSRQRSKRDDELLLSCFSSTMSAADARFLYRNYKKAFNL